MYKRLLFPLVLVGIVAGSFSLLSVHLKSQDTDLKSYLSGMMVAVMGGEGDAQLIRVNLHNGSIALFEYGQLYTMSKVAGTGNPNDSTATPTGEFRILSKELSHTSRLSGVIMPLSMRFFEGYYFHDIPLTPGGAIINTKYSHGCIRLPSTMVRQIYDWTRVGAHVQVYRADLVKDDSSPTVYHLTEDGYRQPIANLQAFTAHGYQWEKVVVIPSAELAGLVLGSTIY
jgi:hypothetical protein